MDIQKTWQSLQGHLEEEYGFPKYKSSISKLKPLSQINDGVLIVGAENESARDWAIEHLTEKLSLLLDAKIEFVLSTEGDFGKYMGDAEKENLRLSIGSDINRA